MFLFDVMGGKIGFDLVKWPVMQFPIRPAICWTVEWGHSGQDLRIGTGVPDSEELNE